MPNQPPVADEDVPNQPPLYDDVIHVDVPNQPPLYNDDISLFGRRADCVDGPGFLGRLLCEDPSLLVGYSGSSASASAVVTSSGKVVGPEWEHLGESALSTPREVPTVPGPAVDRPLGEEVPGAEPRSPPASGPLLSPVVGAPTAACTPVSRADRALDDAFESVPLDAPACSSSDDDGGPAASVAILEDLEERLCLPLQTPLVCGPPRLRRARTPAPAQSLRRSVRIAAAPREVQKLGVATPSPAVDSDTVRKYKTTFREPLSEYNQEALQMLLGEQFDPVAMNLNMLGLDEEAI